MSEFNIPGFKILKCIAETNRSVDLKARQLSNGRPVCLRVLKPECATDPAEVERFFLPARAVVKARHHNLLEVYDLAQSGGLTYLVMEDFDGRPVSALIEQDGRIPVEKALDIALAVAKAMGQVWSAARLVHRNIKPDILRVNYENDVRITDFSLARSVAESPAAEPSDTHVEGTPEYMSPEQATNRPDLDFRSDLYSLGATLYHMITGEEPFSGFSPVEALHKQISGTLTNPLDIVDTLPESVCALLTRLMMKDPANRFSSWEEAAEALQAVRTDSRATVAVPAGESTIAPPMVLPGAKTRRIPVTTPTQKPVDPAAPRRVVVKAAPKRQVTRTAADTGPAPARPAAPAEAPVPAWVRLLAWGGLLFFWLWLACHRLGIPLFGARPGNEAGGETTQAAAPARTAEVEGVSEESALPGNGAQAAAEAAAREAEARRASARQTLFGKLAAAITRKQFASALAALDGLRGSPEPPVSASELETLRQFVADVSRMDGLIATAFEKSVGQWTTVRHGGREIRVALQAMSGNMVNALLIDSEANRPTDKSVTFPLSALSATERCRWLGVASTPEKYTMQFILYMEAGDRQSARKVAPFTGLLADAFMQLTQDKGPAAVE